MEIQIDPHTLERAEERGANENEVMDEQERPRFTALSRCVLINIMNKRG